MNVLGRDLNRVARRLGWEMSPDLGAAEQAVERRAADLAAARRRQRSAPVRVALIAVLAVTLMTTPALIAGSGAITRPDSGSAPAVRATIPTDATNAFSPTGSPDSMIDIPVVGVPVARAIGGAGQIRSCSREDVTLETEFSRDVYPPGDAAVVTLVLRNASGAACRALADICTSSISVFDTNGAAVYSSVAHRYLCQAPGQAGPAPTLRQILQPGQAMTMTFRWLEQSCSGPAGPGCALVAPGRYTVIGDWAGFPTEGREPAILSPGYGLTALPRHVTIA